VSTTDRRRASEFGPENHPKRREGDTRRGKLRAFWRDVAPLVAVVVAGVAVFAAGFSVLNTQSDVERQKEGRAIAVDVLCGFGNGVAEAGRKALAGELAGQRGGRGLPASAQRDYVQTITSTLLAEAGINARDVIRPDGQVDCSRLRRAARAQPGHD
jgi:hypothetical protein